MIVGGVLLFMLLIHLAGVWILRYFVERELHPALPQGTYIGEVHLNLFTGGLKIDGFELRQDDQIRMRFGELDVKVSPWRLLTGTVLVERAVLRQAYARIARRNDGSFDLGLPPFGTDAGPPPAEREPIDLTIAGIDLDRITVEYHDGELASNIYVDKVKVGTYSLRADEQTVPVDLSLRWDGRAIVGQAEVMLAADAVNASGRIETELLDIGRAQQLARLDPVARGEISYAGPFDWKAPTLTLSGAIAAPTLDYAAAGQKASLRELAIPAFSLDLQTAPSVTAALVLDQPLRLAAANWDGGGQGADLARVGVSGKVDYRGDAVEISALDLSAADLAWRDPQRNARLSGVSLTGSVRQALASDAGLPTLQLNANLAGLGFNDTAQALSVDLADLRIDRLGLEAGDSGTDRTLASTLSVGAGKAEQGPNTLGWTAIDAGLRGRIAADLSLAGDIDLRGLSAAAPALQHGPLTIASVGLKGLDAGSTTKFAHLRLQGIDLPAAIPETALTIAAVDLAGGSYAADAGVALGEIVIDGLQTGVIRDKQGAWQHVMSSSAPAAKGAPTVAVEPSAKEQALDWRIGGVRVQGDSHITLNDRGNDLMQPIEYQVEKINVGALSSKAPGKDTPFDVAFRPDPYSEFRINGVVRPLADKLYLKADGHLHGFGLTTVNGLIANDLGHRFLQGQLDNDFRITIENNQLDMANALALSSLEVEEIEGKKGPPLNTAVALLEDRDGNIKLEVPVAGDLSDPQFRVLGALNPIIMKAVAGTAALAIQPLGSVLLVGSLLADQALKVTFEPAKFAAGSTQLDDAARKYLGQLAGKLSEKPKLRVRLCGVVADAERPRNKKGEYTDKESDALDLAQKRAEAVRSYMQGKGASAQQLRKCRPSMDKSEAAAPRVDIKF